MAISMKKQFRLFVALAMTAALSLPGTVSAAAAPADKTPEEGKTLNTLVQSSRTEERPEYQEHTALVMFKTNRTISLGNAERTLRSGEQGVDDISIEEFWTFDTASAEDHQDGITINGGVGSDCNVALVRSENLSTESLIRKLKARSDVLYAEPNYRIHACSVDDEYFNSQWSMQYGENTPNVMSVWGDENQGTTGSSERIVAVVDTGVDYTHPDLQANMWHNSHYPELKGEYGFDFIDGDDDPMDEDGHGTHCAGIIGASGNNGIGISGVNQNIRIMALRTLDAEGTSWLQHEVAAYNYISKALDLGEPVQAINNSWGGGFESRIFAELVNIVGRKGAVSVVAAGNSAWDLDVSPFYPSNIDSPYMIRVAATREDGKLVGFSNYGKDTVDVAAPGTDILSTVSNYCYNPSIYSADKQNAISAHFNNYEEQPAALPGNDENEIPVASAGTENEISAALVNDENEIAPLYEAEREIEMEIVPEDQTDTQEDVPGLMQSDETNADRSSENEAEWAGLPALKANLYLNGEHYDPETYAEAQRIALAGSEDGGFNETGAGGAHAVCLEAGNLQERDLICISIPYEISEEAQTAPFFSFMTRAAVTDPEAQETLLVYDFPKDTPLDYDTLAGSGIKTGIGIIVNDLDNWSHQGFQTLDENELAAAREQGELQRQIVLVVYAKKPGDTIVYFDDLGMTYEDTEPEIFEKYDFMSGTSMAAPFISGAVALYAEETRYPVLTDPETLVSEFVSLAKEPDQDDPIPVIVNGSFDFTKKPEEPGPRIGIITVDSAKGTIAVNGTGLAPKTAGLKVEIGLTGGEMSEPAILSQNDDQIVLQNEGWINNAVDICITGAGGIRAVRRNLYLIGGKNFYDGAADMTESIPQEAMATDGRYIYFADSSRYAILKLDTEQLGENPDILAKVDPNSVFAEDENDLADFVMVFGNDLVYMNGKLYTVAEYGMADQSEPINDDIYSGHIALYASRFRLLSIDTVSGKAESLGELPDDLERTENFTMAAYNGKLYFMGGYDHGTGNLTAAVKVFDPGKSSGERWSEGTPLPEPRSGGKALQIGSKLIYTLGRSQEFSEEEPASPANLIFNGSSWTVSSVPAEDSIRPQSGYTLDDAVIGIAKGGPVYLGLPAVNYGDTFVYDISSDAFADTGYNFVPDLYKYDYRGIAVRDMIYAFNGSNVFVAPLSTGSGFPTISVSRNTGGTVSGPDAVPAGNDASFTVKARKGYAIKSIVAGGSSVKVTNLAEQTVTIPKVRKDQKLKVTFQKIEKVTDITISPSSFTCSGNVQKPKVTVKDSKGNTISASNYTLAWSDKNSKNVGAYTVTVTMKGYYSGSKTLTYKINPKGTKLSSVTAGTKQFTAKWTKQTVQTSGYQICYSPDKSFKSGNKTVTVKSNKTDSATVKKLTSNKTYYVRIRTYKTVSGRNYYSAWSAAKKVKVQ